MKKIAIASLVAVFALTGCNTIKGFGKNASKAGEPISNEAQKLQNK